MENKQKKKYCAKNAFSIFIFGAKIQMQICLFFFVIFVILKSTEKVGLVIDLRFSGEIIPKLNRTELEEAEEKSFFKRNAFT